MISVVATGYAVVVELGNSVTLECPLLGTYPVWTGPDTLNMPLTSSGGVVYEPSVQYVNQSGLMIDSVGVKHNGTYQCYNGTSTSTVHLMVTCKWKLYKKQNLAKITLIENIIATFRQ